MTQPANESNANRPGEFIPHRGTINEGERPAPEPEQPPFVIGTIPLGTIITEPEDIIPFFSSRRDRFLYEVNWCGKTLDEMIKELSAADAAIKDDITDINIRLHRSQLAGLARTMGFAAQRLITANDMRLWQGDIQGLEEKLRAEANAAVPRGPIIQVHDFVAPKPEIKPEVRPGDMFVMHPSENDPRDFAIAPEADPSDFLPPSIPVWLYPLLGALVLVTGWLAAGTVLTP